MTTPDTKKRLEQLDDNLWTLVQPLTFMKTQVGTRTTVIRLPDGKLWIHSPGPELPGVYHELIKLGDVAYLVAPNTLHQMFLPTAFQLFPTATLYGTAAVIKKHPRLPIQLLQSPLSASWPQDIQGLILQGLRMEEWVFFHQASKSLILTDLLFNLQASDLPTQLMLHLEGVYNKLGCTRLVSKLLLRDRRQLKASCEDILDWDFQRILMCHGETVEVGAQAGFRQAMAFTE